MYSIIYRYPGTDYNNDFDNDINNNYNKDLERDFGSYLNVDSHSSLENDAKNLT